MTEVFSWLLACASLLQLEGCASPVRGQPARRASPMGAPCPLSPNVATIPVFVLAGLPPSAEMRIPLQIKCLSWLGLLSNCFSSSDAYGDNG